MSKNGKENFKKITNAKSLRVIVELLIHLWICQQWLRMRNANSSMITYWQNMSTMWNPMVIYNKVKVGDHSRGWPEGSLFDSLLHQGVGEGATPLPGLLHFTLDPYLIMLSVKQGGIKYLFLSLWYDSTWDWTQVSWAIGEHSNR